jgi:hypothetical protein
MTDVRQQRILVLSVFVDVFNQEDIRLFHYFEVSAGILSTLEGLMLDQQKGDFMSFEVSQ